MMSEHETDPMDDDIIDDDEEATLEDDSDDFDALNEESEFNRVEDVEDVETVLEFESELDISEGTQDDLEPELDYVVDGEMDLDLESEFSVPDEFEDELSSRQGTADELDIDAALAAVSQLTLLTQDEPIDYGDEADYEPAPEDTIQEFSRESKAEHHDAVDFEQPRDLSMSRGQMASIIPALTLIILGGWLTFTLTTSNTPPTIGFLFSVILIAVGAIFLSQWLTSARWSRGNFFFGSLALLIGGIQFYFSQISPNTLNNGWTLWVVALGIALFGTGYITVPRLPRLAIMGFITVIVGAIGYVLTSGILDPTVITFVSNLWFVGVAIVVFMMIAPLIRRRQ